ncbi:hypothetical protein BVG80_03095 [Sphingobacteriales bacterium TSM_CSM]|nr:hypothetical protein BVG80_03095 [Sphingobacteriales bacterium TSM_CSM]
MGGVNCLLYGQASTPLPEEMGQEAANLLSLMSSADTSFYAISNMSEIYIQNNLEDEHFAKHFARWHHFWSNRVGADGNIWAAKEAMQDWSNEPICAENGNWHPLTAQLCPNIQARGIVVSVYAPPCNTPNCNMPQVIYAGTNCSGLWKTSDGGDTWNCLTDNMRMPGLGVSSILVLDDNLSCPEEIFIASGLTSQVDTHYGIGIFKTCDGGSTWEESLGWSDFYGEVSVKLMRDPIDANTIWTLTRTHLYKSVDRGNNWTLITGLPSLSNLFFNDMEFLPNDPTQIALSTTVANVQITPYHVDLYLLQIIAATNSVTYTVITPTPIATSTTAQQILLEVYHNAASNEDYIYALYKQVSGMAYISKAVKDITTDSWVWQDNLCSGVNGLNQFLQVFKVHPANEAIMYYGKIPLYLSTDEGVTFNPITSSGGAGTTSLHDDVRDLQIYDTNPNNVSLLMGNDGGVSFSTNGGYTFQNMNGEDNPNGSSLNITQFYDIANSSLQPGVVAGGTQDNSYFKYDNGSYICLVEGTCANPVTNTIKTDGGQTIISWKNPQVVFSRFNQTMRKSTDGGNIFSGTISPDPGLPDFGFLDPKMQQDPLNPNLLYYAKGKRLYKIQTEPSLLIADSYDFGTNFSDFTIINALGVAPSDPNIIFVAAKYPGEDKKLFRYNDVSFTSFTSFTDVSTMSSTIKDQTAWWSITDIIIHPTNPDKIWLAFGGFGGDRVAYSSDGGITWGGFGTGLPDVPINKLVYHVGSNDVIYAATDVGVYRYNPDTQIWECYNNNLPVCVVMGIEIDYCKQLLHIGTFGRGIWESPLAPLTENWQIAQNTTWEAGTVTNSSTDIEIMPGATLTLKGKLNLAENKRVIVQRGAKFVIEGDNNPNSENGLLTNGCGDRHAGIEIWGNTAVVHADLFTAPPAALTASDYINVLLSATDPGIVVLHNGATIENARTAITTQRRGGYFPNHYGGIVFAQNSNFTNNRKAVELMQYKHQNYSRFNNCIISANNPTLPFEGITVWACTGITINQCQFNYNATQTSAYDQIGIAAWDANKLNITNDCQFNNLKYGITLQATNYNLGNAGITNNQFTNCRLGIQNLQTHSMVAQNNVFTHTSASAQHITLGGTCGYNIQNNTFNNGNGVVAFFTSQATPGNNIIECNTYNNCTIGNYIYDNNEGLYLIDNTFNTTIADNALQKGDANGSIAFSQGGFGQPHFNLFSTNTATQHFKAPAGQTDLFVYFYHTDPLYTPEVNARLAPKCDAASTCTPVNNFLNAETISDQPYSGCLDLNGDGIAGMAAPNPDDCQTKECYYAAKAYLDNLKNEIDGGDKADLLNSLYNSPEALATYQKYMAASPYLSDEVLITAANADLMSPNHRANILLSNAPLSNEAMYQIQDLVAPNVYQLLYTIKYYTKFSARDNLNLSISRESAKKEELLHNLLQKFADEKDYAQLDEILTAENTTYAIRALLSSKVEREHYTDAQAMLSYLPADTPDEQNYKTVQQINLQRLSATEGFELSEAQYQTLHTIADAYGAQAPAAQALLGLLRGEHFDWQIPEDDAESGKTDAHPRYKDVALLGKSVLNRLVATPNPANYTVNVQLPAYFTENSPNLSLYDTHGKQLKSWTIDKEQANIDIHIDDLPNGIYLLNYTTDGTTLANTKLVIQH